MSGERRNIRDEERELIYVLAEHAPRHRNAYLRHTSEISQVEDWDDGTHSITIIPDRNKKIAVQAVAADADGGQIEVILWANDTQICLLEMFRSDGQAMKQYPTGSTLKDIWDRDGNPRPASW